MTIEITITGPTYATASEVVTAKPMAQNVRLAGRMWLADIPGEGSGLTVGRLPSWMVPDQVPPEERSHPGLNLGFENFGLTKQGDYYGLLPGPGLGLLGDQSTLRRWLPWILAGLALVLVAAAASRKGGK
jgi:hypothetical protein